MRSCSLFSTLDSSTRPLPTIGGRCPGRPEKVTADWLLAESADQQTDRASVSVCVSADFQRFWCSVDHSLLLYESEGSAEPVLRISAQDVVCVGVSRPDSATNSSNNNNGFINRSVPGFWVPVVLVHVVWVPLVQVPVVQVPMTLVPVVLVSLTVLLVLFLAGSATPSTCTCARRSCTTLAWRRPTPCTAGRGPSGRYGLVPELAPPPPLTSDL